MKTFIVLRYQGGGCDYTIGCGYKWNFIEAKSKKDAIAYAVAEWGGYFEFPDVCGFQEFTMYEVGPEIDLGPLSLKMQQEAREKKERKKEQDKEEAERKQYERLKKKFDK